MKDYLTLGNSPINEDCVQVNSHAVYLPAMKAECQLFKKQLERMFPDIPDNTCFRIKSFSHDFGEYLEVCIIYDTDDENSCDFAYEVEGNLPEYWDAEARKELYSYL